MIRARVNGRIATSLGKSIVGVVLLALLVLVVGAGRVEAEPSSEPFAIVPGSFHLVPSSYQAGAHADWTLTFDIAHNKGGKTFNDLRSTLVNYPAGFMADNTTVPTCTLTQLLAQAPPDAAGSLCPPASQVGTISFDITLTSEPVYVTSPVYNIETTSFGVTAQLGFKTAVLTQILPVTVRPADSGITGTSPNIKELAEPYNVSLTIWGEPAAHEHDPERGRVCAEFGAPNKVECEGGGQEAGAAVAPFLANPTSCGAALGESIKADSWEEEQPEDWFKTFTDVGAPRGATAEVGPFTECERVHFNPSMKVVPTTDSAESSSGLDVSLEVPQTWDNPYSIATSNVKDATVTLPPGYTINPSAGNGLVGCTQEEYAAETAFSPSGVGCPPESKLGTVVIETPVLAEKVEGSVYIATPYENIPAFGTPEHPGGSLIALYVIAKDPARGIIVKTPGKVIPDPVTGQLTSTFENLPQQPFSKVTLKFTQSTTSPLVSPPVCGQFGAQAELTPSSEPNDPRFVGNALQIEKGIGGGSCPAGGVPSFKPQVISGTQNNDAASYSPFYLRIVREDGEQELTKFSTTLPPGLTGNLTGIPFCSEGDIALAKGKSGAQELAEPSCPAASEIGHTIVEAGVGTVLAQTPGKIYLAGPYNGAPLSIVSITSAKVGPFDLGTVVIRFALDINPITAQVEVSGAQSDPIPHIIKGIVVHVRGIRVYMNRPGFTVNPTNCSPLSITDAVTGAGADPANPADQDTVDVSTPFEAADCASLNFKPAFKATTSGKTSRVKGASLSVKLAMAGAQGTNSNIRSVKVDLPKQLPSRLTTLQKACLAATFEANPAACPANSRVATAKAITPVLPVPLEGPAYFVSHGGAKFPELIVVLQGYGFTIDLHGETFIDKAGITSSTFHTIPDQPVTSFELTLPQGPDSALAANGNLCGLTKTVLVKKKVTVKSKGHTKTVMRQVKQTVAGSLVMPTAFTAQNGMVIHQNTPITVTGCAKAKKKAKRAKAAQRLKPHRGKGQSPRKG